jgi:hypothetical protein
MLSVAALGALAFGVWRVVAELRLLNRSLGRLQKRIGPTLEQIARDGEAAAERAARMQARAADRAVFERAAGQHAAGPRAAEQVPDRPESDGQVP